MKKTSIEIIKKLKASGYEAYWAGGCVRDILMGKDPKDYDIVTSAKPVEIEKTLNKTIPIGKKFGVILAIEKGHTFEVASFRSDAAYTDGRRPDAIYFTDAKEDAKRRDFTINGIFYDPIKKQIYDYVEGQKDIESKTLRFIGNADERIKEDNLRILRAIRFRNALNFKYAGNTFNSVSKNAKLILNVSSERVKDELEKILLLPGRENAFLDLSRSGILEIILPELIKLKGVKQPEKYHKEGDVFTHTLKALEAIPNKASAELVWAVLFHDVGKADTYKVKERIRFDGHAELGSKIFEEVADRLKFSRNLKENVSWLIRHHMMAGDVLKMKPSHQYSWVHNPLFKELVELLKYDELGSKPKDMSMYNSLKKLVENKEELLPQPTKLITGEEIINIFKVSEGPILGKLLKQVHDLQVDGKINTKTEALKFVEKEIHGK
ncbi:CCA tRNA nucleotidyltransferase [bacterium]|nr:CCA tRNA nucleotidyltransferase [bacterium]